jgi:hypothetical protein
MQVVGCPIVRLGLRTTASTLEHDDAKQCRWFIKKYFVQAFTPKILWQFVSSPNPKPATKMTNSPVTILKMARLLRNMPRIVKTSSQCTHRRAPPRD